MINRYCVVALIFIVSSNSGADEIDLSVLNKRVKLFASENPSFNVSGNYRFGFACSYPSYLKPASRSVNGDGIFITNEDQSVTLTCSGGSSYLANITEEYRDLVTRLEEQDGIKITYRALKNNWFVLSGINSLTSKIFYQKSLIDKGWLGDNIVLSFNLEYHIEDEDKYKNLPGQIGIITNN